MAFFSPVDRSKKSFRQWCRQTILERRPSSPPRSPSRFPSLEEIRQRRRASRYGHQWIERAKMNRRRRVVHSANLTRQARLDELRGINVCGDNEVNEEKTFLLICPLERIKQLPMLAQQLNANLQGRIKALVTLRRMLSADMSPPINQVIEAGVVPKFVTLMAMGNPPKVQFEAAWCITNIVSGTSQQTLEVIKCGAIPVLMKLMNSNCEHVVEQAVWALDNIANDGSDCRELLLRHGLANHLIQLAAKSIRYPISTLRNITSCMASLMVTQPGTPIQPISPLIPVVAQLVCDSKDPEIIQQACRAFVNLTEGSDNLRIQAVIESGIPKRIVELLTLSHRSIRRKVLRLIGNIVTGDDLQTQVIIDCGVLPYLNRLLELNDRNITKAVCWSLSNIAAGVKEQIQALIDAKMIPRILQLCRHHRSDVVKEAAWTLSNMTCGASREQIHFLVSEGVWEAVHDLIGLRDPELINIGLQAMINLLRVDADSPRTAKSIPYTNRIRALGGFQCLMILSRHFDEVVRKHSCLVLREFFCQNGVAMLSGISFPQKRLNEAEEEEESDDIEVDPEERKSPRKGDSKDFAIVELVQNMSI